MRYLLLLYENEARDRGERSDNDPSILSEYMAFNQQTQAAGQYLAGEPLQPTSTATTVRVKDGQTITTDGPFAETKEQLGGFYMIEAADLDEAVALAARLPVARTGSVEVRPIMELDLEAMMAGG